MDEFEKIYQEIYGSDYAGDAQDTVTASEEVPAIQDSVTADEERDVFAELYNLPERKPANTAEAPRENSADGTNADPGKNSANDGEPAVDYAAMFNSPMTEKESAMPDYDFDYDEDYENGDIASESFKSYLTTRLASFLIKLRGGVPTDTGNETVDSDVDDYKACELNAMTASKYYGSCLYSLKLRNAICVVLLVLICYLSLGLPVPGMLKALPVAVAAVVAMQLALMLLCLDVISNAAMNVSEGKFGADSLAFLSCLITTADAFMVLFLDTSNAHMPLCAISSLSLYGVMLSSLLSARALRKALRVPAIGKRAYTVTGESHIIGSDITILKSTRPISGYVKRLEEAPADEELWQKVAPLIALIAIGLAVLVAVVKKSASNILYIYSAVFCPAVPFCALLSFALPFCSGSLRMFTMGAAVAGWSGVYDLGRSKNLIVTDRDLFPPECISIDSVRIFADYDNDKVISYAGSLIKMGDTALTPAFEKLMAENRCEEVEIDYFEPLAGGGMRGMIEGHTVICGSLGLMRLMDIKIPNRLIGDTSVLLSIDGILYGIFNVQYEANPKVRRALVSLMSSNRHPVFAVRDFNITPDLIHDKFDVATDGYDFPPYLERFPLSEAKPAKESKISGVICREGLGPLTTLADTSRSIFVVTRINNMICLASALVGTVLAFLKLMLTGSLQLWIVLVQMLLCSLPVIILGVLVNTNKG